MAKLKRIDKNGYIAVVSDEKLSTATVEDYEYEHRLIAEEIIDRPLKEGEEVHHLDLNRANNSPDNLLVLSGPMHAKLHTWLNKNVIIAKPEYAIRKEMGCVRCPICDKPIDPMFSYCSPEHANIGRRTSNRPDKETLVNLINSKPMTKIGKDYGVSDNTIKKWCKSEGIELGDRRGHWMKKYPVEVK